MGLSSGQFVKETTATFVTGVINLALGLGTSVILARALGPEGQGIYALATLLAALIVIFGDLGISPATVYFVAQAEFRRQEILGNNVLLSLGTGGLGVVAGLVVVLFFRESLFPNVAAPLLLLALPLVPVELFFSYTQYVLLGIQRVADFNYVRVVQSAVLMAFIALALLGMKAGVTGAILAGLFAYLVAAILVFRLAVKAAGGVDLKPNPSYIRQATAYGVQAHLSNILGFLNYRVDMFMVNWFLGPAAVGLYTVGVGMVEKLWMTSQAASTVLFPRVAAETNEERRKGLTPLVARTVLWTTALGALLLAILSRWIVLLLYSEAFLPAVGALQALLVGIVALSAARVLANDISGRGFPGLNIYTGIAAVTANVALNLLWIPRYGIAGAAWASTVSYMVLFLSTIFFYCRLSGNQWTVVLFPQREDWELYWKMGKAFYNWALAKVRVVL
ncbi:MAG: flippase [Methanothrix sp.]|jgi:O-antigen/teichoic acid export membrane protein|uniref:flippase n=1 Tax=Methanothrix sp. TaxID=90426 RepID=UPI00247E4354|nr:flippase [Methanothrix sp.]